MKNRMHIGNKILCTLLAVMLCGMPARVFAEESSQPVLVDKAYLDKALAELEARLREEFASGGLQGQSGYTEKTFPKGTVLELHAGAEAIFRGGNAIVITSSPLAGEGFTDLSDGRECFSGDTLRTGHIYYPTNPESHAYLLVIGDKAAFTMKGPYETR